MEPMKILVSGQWRQTGNKRQVFNPYDNKAAGEVFQAGAREIDEAIAAADEAFQQTRRSAPHERHSALAAVSRGLAEHKDEFAALITAETGKPITLSRGEVERAVFTMATSAEEALRVEGSVLPLDVMPQSANRTAIIRRFPLGVIGAITPFNYPLNLVAHKLGPAIAAGNTVVLKPSSNAPQTALRFAELFMQTGLPQGALNVVPCMGSEIEQLITDKRVKLISFTGSPAVGWGIKARSGRKRVLLELGGNAGVIVCADAQMDHALKSVAQGAFANAGQSCISVQRVYLHESIAEYFTAQLVKLARSIAAGDPMNPRTVVGPMIDEQAARKVESWIQEAVAGGARVLCGGTRKGALLEPTVMADVAPEMKVSCQEAFAPVVTVDRFTDFRDALERVNTSSYGLQAGVFTNNAADIFTAYRELEVGGVIVNDASSFRVDHMPYGGTKESGLGREGVRYAIEEMSEMKLLSLNFS
ncbi:MAG TPA: aldehyde dehydrogenase family protein [Bacteroidota bacterium]|nr:aldehyde dehydrogenase family protein [Bacteroidota bacterium]